MYIGVLMSTRMDHNTSHHKQKNAPFQPVLPVIAENPVAMLQEMSQETCIQLVWRIFKICPNEVRVVLQDHHHQPDECDSDSDSDLYE